MIFADSSLLLETVIGQGERQALAQQALGRAGRFVTTDAVLTEVWNLLWVRGHRVRTTPATLAFLERGRILTPSEDERAAARAILTEWADQPFSYCDALSFAVMVAHGIDRVLSFDRHFAAYRFGPGRTHSFTVLP